MIVSRRTALGAGVAASAVALVGCGADEPGQTGAAAPPSPSSTPSSTPSATPTATAPATAVAGAAQGSASVTDVVATGLNVPWGLARLPDGTVLITSRDDRQVLRLDLTTGEVHVEGDMPEAVSGIAQRGEGGLLGIAVSPSYDGDGRLFLYYSTADDNRVVALRHRPDRPAGRRLGAQQVVVDGIPHGTIHNGGRLAFAPDGMLMASTGESGQDQLAQDLDSLGGKILRMTPDGGVPPGSPFGTLVHSYGHRNVQGLAYDSAGRLLASEFGDQETDELNVIVAGVNYGWPATEGRTDDPDYTAPIATWGTDEDSPSGIAIAAGCVWMAALQGECLWRIPLDGDQVVAEPVAFLKGDHGRLRGVLALDEATLLVSTSNTDGRGDAGSDDDQILRVTVT